MWLDRIKNAVSDLVVEGSLRRPALEIATDILAADRRGTCEEGDAHRELFR